MMSESIWHKLPTKPEEDRLIVVKSKRTGEYLVGSEFEFILENFTKWAYFDDLLALETELAKCKKQVKKLREQNRTLTESLGEYFNRWIDANIQAIKDKDQIRVLTEQEQARHQLIIDQIKGLK
jgi:hypothetical protein